MLTTTIFAGGTGKPRTPRAWKSVLLVTSHPDDESMFFGPTIQARSAWVPKCTSCACRRQRRRSRRGQGQRARRRGGLFRRRVGKLVDDAALRDGFEEKWPVEAVAAELTPLRKVGAETVVTFDAGGISGHRTTRRRTGVCCTGC